MLGIFLDLVEFQLDPPRVHMVKVFLVFGFVVLVSLVHRIHFFISADVFSERRQVGV